MKAFLEYIQTIHPLSPASLEALAGICTMQSYKKNAEVQPIGHTCKTIYFIKKGALRIYYFKGEVDITDSIEFENAFVARAESLISGQPSRKGIQAIENTEVISINAMKLPELYDTYIDIERLFKKIMLKALLSMINRIESIQFQSADERYSNFIKDHPDILKRVPLKYIASILGITQVSLSRIRAKH